MGFAVALLMLYLAGVLSSAALFGTNTIRVVANLALALVAGGSVFLGWRWPRVALTAGVVILVLALFVAVTGISAPGSETSLDAFGAVVNGARATFAATVGAVLVCASVTARIASRRR